MKKNMKKRICAMVVLGAVAFIGEAAVFEGSQVQAATVKNGLKKENGKYYYYVKGKKVKSTWKTIEYYGKCYFGKDGSAYIGWKKVGSSYYCFDTKGRMQRLCIKKVNGKYYYFGDNGKIKKSAWVSYKGSRYYLSSNGAALTGIRLVNGKFCQFASNGKMNVAKSRKLRAAAVYESDFSTLKKLLGTAKKTKSLGAGCFIPSWDNSGEGFWTDYEYTYNGFKVWTSKKGDQEVFLYAE
ncbi:MAG: hypothetical protein Q4F41_00800 [Eubacteriales bacterium]|nr:hypothetical protein [Eubacteriales bacterium]